MSAASPYRGLAALLAVAYLGAPAAQGAEGWRHHRHHTRQPVDAEQVVVPQGYAYGGYGNGPGPGWTDGRYGPAGFGPGYGYIAPGYPDAGFDLGR